MPRSNPSPQPASRPLRREIGLLSLTFIGVSGVLGSGWLFAPLLASQLAGPAALLGWLLGGLAIGLLAMTFAEIAAMLPVAGGIARLPQFSHGNVVSMAMGWSAWIGYNTTAPIEVEAMLRYLAPHLPWLYQSSTPGNLTALGMLTASLMLLLFTVLNIFGVRVFARLNASITWLKLLVPILVAAVLMLEHFDGANLQAGGGFFTMGTEGILASIASGGIIFAYLGFRHTIDLAGEAKNPQFTVPAAILLTILICFVIYASIQLAFLGALTEAELADGWKQLHFSGDFGPLSGLAAAAGILWLVSLLNLGAVIAPFGGALVAVGSMGRLALALAQNGFFPRALERLNRFGVPASAMLLNFVVASLIFVLLPFSEILSLNSAAIILSFAVGPIALIALRRLDPARQRGFRLPAAGILAPLAFIVSTLIIYWSGWDTYWRLALCLAIGLLLLIIKVKKTRSEQLDLAEAAWLIPFLGGLGIISYLGDFGQGLRLLPFGWDILLISLFGLAVFWYAVRCRLSAEKYARYLRKEQH
ncbi:APC family permease [Halochromatium glycolicum]|uniref:Amino acid permease n=1 Tax=Halochromatium glycolicum TaxID=85075 RepID=A0AAJ0U721_9GAMM|nr:APC family permease [Halochromatium glycolicum]MBK1705672.1 amino acid permease [Halochromatium glycolicum]